jgi:predicted hotdog family 3-hydroxylacyl-ACP dehydratase
MCLLACVLDWDAEHIRCLCTGHRDLAHPLRWEGRLGIAAGIELASQAMAAHGALTTSRSEARTRFGLLASLRSVKFEVVRLDDIAADLICSARRLASDDRTALYEFSVGAAGRRLLAGRATVVLDADAAGAYR